MKAMKVFQFGLVLISSGCRGCRWKRCSGTFRELFPYPHRVLVDILHHTAV